MAVKVIDAFRLIVAKNNNGAVIVGAVEADADNDTLTLSAGTGIGLSVDPATDTVTISALGLDQLLSSALGRITIFADDSTLRVVQGGESFGILGTGAVNTTSNSEGDISIDVPLDLSTYDNSTSLFVAQGDNISLLTNDANYITNATASITAGQVSGLAAVATSGTYSDLTSRPNLTFDGDLSGNTGGALGGGASTITLTLDNVNSNVGTFNTVTVNAKGLVTGATNTAYLTAESDTLDSVVTRGATTSKNISVGEITTTKVNVNGVYSLPTFLGQEGEVLKIVNGKLTFGEGGGTGIGDGAIYIAADDSSIKRIDAGETLSILGSGAVSTSSDIEGAITVTVSTDLSTFDNSTTQFISAGGNISQFTNDSGYLTTESDTLASVTGRGAITNTAILISTNTNTPLTVISTENSNNPGPYITAIRDRDASVQNNDYIGGLLVKAKNSNNEDHDYGSAVWQIKNKTLNSETSVGILRSYQSGSSVDSITYGNGLIKLNHDVQIESTYGIQFDGATPDANYTKIIAIDPTGSNTISLPDASGTVALTADLTAYTQQGTQHVGSLKGNVYANDGVSILVDAVNGTVPGATLAEEAVALETARGFEIVGVVSASPVSFNGTGGVTLNTSFTNLNLSQFNNDVGFVTQGLSAGSPLSLFTNDVGYITAFNVTADDSSVRTINSGETIQFVGSGNVTTSSDAEGKITINVPTTVSSFTNDAGYNTQNDVITLYGDITGSGRTSINTSLNLNLSNISPGTYNYVEFDTRGIAQTGELKDYVEAGQGISKLVNDAGYLTGIGSSLRFVGNDSTGFNVPAPGNDITFEGTRGITVFASNETVTIQGPFTNTGQISGDLQGSVFAEDSTVLVNALDGTLATLSLERAGANDGEVLAYSTALGRWHPVNLTSGGAVQYTDAQVDARIVAAGSANWNTAYGWGDHSVAGYFTTAALSTTSITELFDVNTITNPPVNGNSLIWSTARQQWEPGVVQPAPLSFTDLTDTPNIIAAGPRFILVNNAGGTAIEWLSLSTNNVPEGTNLYYTTTRANADFDTRLATRSTTNLAEGTNLYYTDTRSRNAISVTGSGSYNSTTGVIDIQGGVTSVNTQTGDVVLDTDDVAEGSNLYYTNARVDARIGLASVDDLADVDTASNPPNTGQALIWHAGVAKWVPGTIGGAQGGGILYTDLSATSTGVGTLSYDANTGNFSYAGITNTSGLPEGTNLYFTNARADARADLRIAAADIEDLNNVSVTPPTAGQALVWNGSMWAPGTVNTEDSFMFGVAADDSTLRIIRNDESIKFIGSAGITTSSDAEGNITISGPNLSSYLTTSSSINSLSDVVIGSPTTGYVLKYDGNNWVPAPESGSSGGGIALTDLSVTQNSASGTGTLTYNNVSGIFTYTPPDLTGYVTASSSTAFTNKTGNISQWTNDSGYVTASSSTAFTNKTGNISQWTNDEGFIANQVIDDDTFATALSSTLSSSESTKAYVDNQINTYTNVSSVTTGTKYVALYDSQTGQQAGKTASSLTYNVATGAVGITTLTATTIEANTIQAPNTITGTWTLASPTTLTLDAGTEIKAEAPFRHVVKSFNDLGSLTVSTGTVVLVMDANYHQFMYDGSAWKPVATPTYYYEITANASSAYRFSGPGVSNTTDNPNFTLYRGSTYIFNNTTGGGHPFAIRTSNGGGAFTEGVTGSQSGIQVFEVPHEPSDTTLVYQCTLHSVMVGNLTIV